MAIATDQHAVGSKECVTDCFRGSLVRCSVVAGLGPAGGLADGAEGHQLLQKGPLGVLSVRVVGRQC